MIANSSIAVQSYKYNGKELDEQNGLDWYDYGARMYDAALGRFLAVDLLAEISYSINPYTYCLNNPFNRVDPSEWLRVTTGTNSDMRDEQGNEVSWESAQNEYGIEVNP